MWGRKKKKESGLLKLDEWNEEIQFEYEQWNSFPKPAPVLCNKCGARMEDQYHVDFSQGGPARRQVICRKCKHSSYRLMGKEECMAQCPVLVKALAKQSE